MVLSREPAGVALLGTGESSDAYHISAPHPQGEGAIRAITQALNDAGLQPEDIGYINLARGTATPLNDQIESHVVHDLFGENVPCSSTKHLTGHTLGAAGITEAALSWLILTRDLPLPPQDFARYAPDETLSPCGVLHQSTALKKPVILSNSFAFVATTPASCWGECHELLITRRLSPHDAPMMLLGSVERVTDDSAVCRVAVNGQSVLAPFLNAEGDLPGWYALELMAQTVGVWSGWHRQQKGQDHIALGMVLGARELVCAQRTFRKRRDAGHHRQTADAG